MQDLNKLKQETLELIEYQRVYTLEEVEGFVKPLGIDISRESLNFYFDEDYRTYVVRGVYIQNLVRSFKP